MATGFDYDWDVKSEDPRAFKLENKFDVNSMKNSFEW